MPTLMTSAPLARMPFSSAAKIAGPDARESCAMITWGFKCSLLAYSCNSRKAAYPNF